GDNSSVALYGDAAGMSGSAHGGGDVLTATISGANSFANLYGDAANMSGSAPGGNDVLNGGDGSGTLYGDAQTYFVSSPGSITGGTDALNGGRGNDQLWGGPNNDTFVFQPGSGNDVINDFDKGNLAVGTTAPEHDVINVQAYGFADWHALQGVISD